MPIDASIYGQIQAPKINTPFENLRTVMDLRTQQENARGLKEQREAIAEQRRAQTEKAQRENAEAAAVRALFSRVDPTTGTPAPPTMEELAGVTDPKKAADIFSGFEAVKKARNGNAKDDIDRIASVLGGLEALPAAMRPDAYMGALKVLTADGTLKPGQVPAVYDPAFVKAKRREALTALQQFEQDKPIEVSAGASLMSPGGHVIGTAPASASANKPSSVQEYEYAKTQGFKGSFEDYQNADANRKQRAASERAPYFTYQPVFDATGKPISAIRFDARGGPPVNVDVSALTGGGQLKPPPGTTGAQAIGNEVSTVQLDRLRDLFEGGGKAFVGPAAGTWEGIKQKTPGVQTNKTYADFSAATAAFRNSVIKAITGAQMSEPEAKRIREQIPDVTDKPDVWRAKAEQSRKNLQDLQAVLAKKPAPPTEIGRFKIVQP